MVIGKEKQRQRQMQRMWETHNKEMMQRSLDMTMVGREKMSKRLV